MAERLVVKITHGPEALERLNQGLTVAAMAVASGVEVSLWLTGEAAALAVPGEADGWQLPLAAPATELRDAVLAAGTLTVCAQCAGRRSLTEADLVPGVVIRGAASFVEEVMAEGTQALVY